MKIFCAIATFLLVASSLTSCQTGKSLMQLPGSLMKLGGRTMGMTSDASGSAPKSLLEDAGWAPPVLDSLDPAPLLKPSIQMDHLAHAAEVDTTTPTL